MQITGLRKIWILTRIFCISASDTLKVLVGSWFTKQPRLYISATIHHWAKEVLKILQVNYEVPSSNHLKFLPDRPYLIMSNHCSHLDIPLIYETFPHQIIGMIAKKELFSIPLFGRGMKLGGCVMLDRKDPHQAIKDLELAKESMLSGTMLWIAPEGTRSVDGTLGPFKKGGFKLAQAAKAVILPVTIEGSHKILPAKTLAFSLGETVKIYLGKPIDALDYPDLQQLMVATAKEIARKNI